MNTDVVLMRDKGEGIFLGVLTPLGILPIVSFSSFDELRRFAMGVLGYCEFFSPEVPEVFLRAFEEK